MACIRLILSILLTISTMQLCLGAVYNVLEYGAKADGMTDSTEAFKNAWNAACACAQRATFYIPDGSFLVNQIKFRGPCKNGPLLFQIDGTIVSPDYTDLYNAQIWLHFSQINGIDIHGGVLDGRGKSLWDCKTTAKNCPQGTTSLQISKCEQVNVRGLTSLDSQFYHMHVYNSKHVMLDILTITAPWDSPNTDGIHVSFSNDVHIQGSNIGTGDDCISISEGTTDLWIENINCGPGHGISIGSLGKTEGEPKVENITVTDCTFTETQNGVRIKTYPLQYAGSVDQVTFQHNTMNNVRNPILIDQHYCNGKAQHCSGPGSGVKISNVSYIDIHGTSATPFGVNFNCSETNPCSGLLMESIDLNGESSCANSFGVSMGTISPPCCLQQ